MPKGAQKRIDQTVTFIQENHNLRLEVRKVVAEHCQYYTEMDRVGPVFHNKKHLTTFSKSMSQKDNPNAGEKPARHYRRALRMLYRSMDRFDEEKTVDAMPEANLIPAFRTIADEVYLYADKAGIACRAKLNEFRASPKQFLDDNEIFISGHKKKETGHVRGPAWFLMHYEPARERFVFDPMGAEHDNPDLPGYRFQAISVPAVAHDDASEHKNFQELVPTELKDLDIMLTTQFSGCSFCFQQTGGKVYAAHIAPDEARTKQDPIALAGRLRAPGTAFKGVAGPGFTVYGRGGPGTSGTTGYVKAIKAMLIIGVKNAAGTWEIFSQHVGMDKGSRPTSHQIL